MATYKGHDIAKPDQSDEDLKLRGGRLPGMENIEEELNLPPEAGTERARRPGEKGYLDTKPGTHFSFPTLPPAPDPNIIREPEDVTMEDERDARRPAAPRPAQRQWRMVCPWRQGAQYEVLFKREVLMVAQRFGSSDPDIHKGSKEISDKPKLSPSTRTPYTGMIGGPANMPGNPDERGGKSANQGSKVSTPPRSSIAPYNEGGFRNAAMEHKR